MIQKFNEFITESVRQNEFIAEPVSDFIRRFQERSEMYIKYINDLVNDMYSAIEDVKLELGDILVGEPIIKVPSDLEEIEVIFNTNIPNTEDAWETDESPAQSLDMRISDMFYRYKNINASVSDTPNEDGNCTFSIQTFIITEKNFGDFTDALKELGKEW